MSYSEVISSPDAVRWQAAIKEEMNALIENKTWTFVKLPQGSRAIGCKWVFAMKTHSSSDSSRNKEDYEIAKINIRPAFLYSDLQEEVYMKQPDGYIDQENKDLVCQLQRIMYGLENTNSTSSIFST